MAYQRKERAGFLVMHRNRALLDLLSDEERGKLLVALLNYSEHGAKPDVEERSPISFVFAAMAADIDRHAESWEETCERNRQNRLSAVDGGQPSSTAVDGGQPSSTAVDGGDQIKKREVKEKISSCRASAEAHEKKCLKKVFDHESNPYKAARYLSEQICKRLTTIKPHPESTLQNWAADFDKCNRLDGHDWPEIERVLVFAQEDAFWQQNILSGQKFRSQYVQLLARMGGTQ